MTLQHIGSNWTDVSQGNSAVDLRLADHSMHSGAMHSGGEPRGVQVRMRTAASLPAATDDGVSLMISGVAQRRNVPAGQRLYLKAATTQLDLVIEP